MTLTINSIGKLFRLSLALVLCISAVGCDKQAAEVTTDPVIVPSADLFNSDLTDARVLVFTKTAGWRHESIPAGVAALKQLADEYRFTAVDTDDASVFTDDQLQQFNAIVFLNTTLNVLDEEQEIAMERFIQAGGGFVGIHAAADTEWEGSWHWYRKLLGGVFKSHPDEPSNVQHARLNVVDHQHTATSDLPETFHAVDEWYDFRDLYPFRNDLLMVDEKSYIGGLHGDYHPITWYHEFDGGRSFYTGLGHTSEIFSDEHFLALLTRGLRYAVGGKPELDYARARPENNRFVKKTLIDNLDEPMSFAFFPNGDVLIAERPGTLKFVNHSTGETADAGKINVAHVQRNEFGLIGIAFDHQFDKTRWLYATYNHQDETGQLWQRLSRFNWQDQQVNNDSEIILLQFKVDENCCHTGGDMHWGHNGELFVSTGDNSNPHEQNGHAPIDFREDNARNDALRSAGNTRDFRGKILRIIPQADGTYTIPEGNLFSDPEEGLPEIYVMGARNPFTISYDKPTNTLYFGDIGPDANQDSAEQGPRGYDEINRVTGPGNFGWPLFIGDNIPYMDYNFETKEVGRMFNPLQPHNKSPRNSGAAQLPPAQPALLWYPYGTSEDFPELGSGGRMALVADVFRTDNYPAGQHRYPGYYDGKLFILEAMRGWVKAVTLDEFGRIVKTEPFAPQLKFTLPTDARFSPDGSLYVLEYGSAWFVGNTDARLTRVEYVGADNRAPEPVITVAASQGAAPMRVQASALASTDPDGDSLRFRWLLVRAGHQPEEVGTSANLELALDEPGVYQLRLVAEDPAGASATAETQIDVGNAPAEIDIALAGNTSFFWPDTKTLDYRITITDAEDGVVTTGTGDASGAHVSFDFAAAEASEAQIGHQTAGLDIVGKDLVEANACSACHQVDAVSVGPSFRAVADRHKNSADGLGYLVDKIGAGGSGAWGSNNMPGYAHLSEEDRTALATYVLSLATEEKTASLPLSGQLALAQHGFSAKEFTSAEPPAAVAAESYTLTVAYTDKGGEMIGPITAEKTVQLIPARMLLRELPAWQGGVDGFVADRKDRRNTLRAESGSGQWRVLPVGDFDLTGIESLLLGYWVVKNEARWEVEVRVGTAAGRVIAQAETGATESYQRLLLTVDNAAGVQPLFIAVRSVNQPASDLHLLDLTFRQ